MKKLFRIFQRYRFKLTVIYLFMLLTELSLLCQPFLLGKSIDGLMSGTWLWLVLLAVSYLVSDFFNYKRMVFDTKVYTTIYNDIVLKFLEKSDADTPVKVARTDMAHQIVDVLEGYVHYYIATIVTIAGTITYLYAQNWMVGVLVSCAFIFIMLAVLLFYKKIRQVINIRNNHYEKKAEHIAQGYDQSVLFFQRRKRLAVYESTLHGKNWLLVGLIKHLFLIAAIIILVTTTQNLSAGNIVTVYSYISNFLSSLMSIPVAFEMYSRLSNIIRRID